VSFRVSFRPEIPFDLASAATWYDDQRIGLGDEFLAEYRLALECMLEQPLLRAEEKRGMRFWLLKRFPYRICYYLRSDEIVVAAVFHVRRNPARLRNRG
jgi:plasmid stabilization system protein ParE